MASSTRSSRKKAANKDTISDHGSETNADIAELFKNNEKEKTDKTQDEFKQPEEYTLSKHTGTVRKFYEQREKNVNLQKELKNATDAELAEEMKRMKVEMANMKREHQSFNDWYTELDQKIDTVATKLQEEIDEVESKWKSDYTEHLMSSSKL